MPLTKSSRIESIDILRGLVMVIMALDHVRDYFHINAFTSNFPENLETTNLVLFGTRFITHFCAPVFVFLAGTSAYLYGQNKRQSHLSKFLITRGFWLIFVEIIINNFMWWFDVSYGFINLQVIWAIGICMLMLGLAIYLPKRIILAIGLLIVFAHNTLDGITRDGQDVISVLWYMLHQSNWMPIGDDRFLAFSYPVLPWIGVMLLGYCFGQLYRKNTDVVFRKKRLLYMGIIAIIMFLILRTFNIYGDPSPWAIQEAAEKTIISFLSVSKYPPSLSYLLITLGPAFLFLYGIEGIKHAVTRYLIVFGRVPFFYYILHIFVIHIGAMIGLVLTRKDWKLMILDNETMSTGQLNGYGYSLLTVYIVWILVVVILYPICKFYMNYKIKNKDKWWLSYL